MAAHDLLLSRPWMLLHRCPRVTNTNDVDEDHRPRGFALVWRMKAHLSTSLKVRQFDTSGSQVGDRQTWRASPLWRVEWAGFQWGRAGVEDCGVQRDCSQSEVVRMREIPGHNVWRAAEKCDRSGLPTVTISTSCRRVVGATVRDFFHYARTSTHTHPQAHIHKHIHRHTCYNTHAHMHRHTYYITHTGTHTHTQSDGCREKVGTHACVQYHIYKQQPSKYFHYALVCIYIQTQINMFMHT